MNTITSGVQVTKMPTFKNQGLPRRAQWTSQLAWCPEAHSPELWIARRNRRAEDTVVHICVCFRVLFLGLVAYHGTLRRQGLGRVFCTHPRPHKCS